MAPVKIIAFVLGRGDYGPSFFSALPRVFYSGLLQASPFCPQSERANGYRKND